MSHTSAHAMHAQPVPDLPGYANVDAQKEQPPAGDDNSSTGSNHGQEASKSASHEALESTDRRSLKCLLQGSHFRGS